MLQAALEWVFNDLEVLSQEMEARIEYGESVDPEFVKAKVDAIMHRVNSALSNSQESQQG